MSERIDVMISSTREDLKDYRLQAKQAIEQWGGYALVMENLPASPDDAITASLKMVDDAEVYIGIFAHRYGYIPDSPRNPDKISITEMEYRHALERDIPTLIFIMADEVPVVRVNVEQGEGAVKLYALKELLKAWAVVEFFTSPEDFRSKLLLSLDFLSLTFNLANPKSHLPTREYENGGVDDAQDIFISYSREDSGFLTMLVGILEGYGFSIWTDSALERGSKSFAREIKAAVKRTKLFVVVCSPDSEQSEWVENEIAIAQEYEKPIFPIFLRGKAIDAIPARLITYQRYDFTTDDFPKALEKLVKALRANL